MSVRHVFKPVQGGMQLCVHCNVMDLCTEILFIVFFPLMSSYSYMRIQMLASSCTIS